MLQLDLICLKTLTQDVLDIGKYPSVYSLSHEIVRTFFISIFYIIGLPGHKNKRESVLEITKMAIHTMLISDIVKQCSLYQILTSFRIGNNDIIVILYG